MRPDDSRHFLPLSSVLFCDTEADLRFRQHPLDNRTIVSFWDRPETGVTALPRPSSSPADATSSGAAEPAKLSKTNKISKRPLRPKKRAWNRMISGLKGVAAHLRWRKGPEIGKPYNFRHVEIGGVHPLRDPVASRHHVEVGDPITVKHHVQLRRPVSPEYPVQLRGPVPARGAAPARDAAPSARGDTGGTAFEDAEAESEWEDIEETMTFRRG